MVAIPDAVVAGQSFAGMLARMLAHPAFTGFPVGPASMPYQAVAPVALELNETYRQLGQVLELRSVTGPAGHRAYGTYLDNITAERGVPRKAATYAAGLPVQFTGTPGTIVPIGQVVTTTGVGAIRFATDAAYTVGVGGTAVGTATALVAGTSGNVSTGTVTLMGSPVMGISAVTNTAAPLEPGIDEESDEALISRYLDEMREPSNGSNPAAYRKWSNSVAGVGGTAVLRPGEPNGPSPGGVDLYIVDTNKAPASQALVDDVQDYIAPARSFVQQAETGMTIFNANGVAVDSSRNDDTGDSQRLSYSAAGAGEVRYAIPTANMVQSGIWTVRPRLAVGNTAGAVDLLEVLVWDDQAAAIAKTRQGGSTDARTVYRANQLALSFAYYSTEFYYDTTHTYSLRVKRLQTDTTTQVFYDEAMLRSAFSSNSETVEGLAPVGHRVQVLPAVPISTSLAVAIKVKPGFDFAYVSQQVQFSFRDYLRNIAFAAENDVIYGAVGASVQSADGVEYYNPASLLVGGGVANVAVAKREVAVPGTLNVTQVP